MGRRLARAIVLAHPKTGIVQSFVPGSEVPEWVAEKVTNESVWAKDEPTAEDAPDPEGDEPTAGNADEGETPEAPPTSGAGSGRDEWAAYAEQIGVTVDPEWSRDQIRDAVEAHSDEQD